MWRVLNVATIGIVLALASCAGSGVSLMVDTGTSPDATEGDVPAGPELSEGEIGEPVPDVGTPDVENGDVFQGCIPGSGCFGEPCKVGSDCLSGFCVDHLGDPVCTIQCVEECPDGWTCQEVGTGGPDVTWLCVSDFRVLCRPCKTGQDCKTAQGQEDVCVDYGPGGSFCGGPCGQSKPCPGGYTCKEAPGAQGGKSWQCVVAEGECPCSKRSSELGLSTDCEVENEFGECSGVRVCTSQGLSDCSAPVPGPDLCNGVDDDCDGAIDEDTCDDGNGCTTDACVPGQGCVHDALESGKCDDQDSCTLGDKCVAGLCTGDAVTCDDGNPCTLDVCDQDTGCKFPPASGSCEDADPCTFGDHCENGKCKPGSKLDCDDSNPCTKDSCDAGKGCVHEPAPGSCDDANPCTTGDKCSGGACVPTALLDCDDANPCTNDWCDSQGCQHEPNEAPCDDGSACTLTDICSQGVCAGGVPLDCDDHNPCTTDSCNPLLGCKHTNNTAPCEDQDPCTQKDQCVGGACVGTGALDCDDGNACTKDYCDPMAGCTHVPGTGACDDANPCTWGDSCKAGSCVGGAPLSCDDANVCTDDSCEPKSGCVHKPNAKPCDDQNQCTTDDHCDKGACISSQAAACDDKNPCTTDICLPQGGCKFLANDNACNDGDACTTGDVCKDSKCIPGKSLGCDDGNPCTTDECSNGACTHAPAAGGCNDSNPCTVGDHCDNGACVPSGPKECDDGSPCTTDYCDPLSDCVYKLNSAPCDDGDICTAGDFCELGNCKPGKQINCDDANVCTKDACSGGVCIHAAVAGECDDGNACTTGDSCSGGLCKATASLDCDDGNACTKDACSPVQGCSHSPIEGPCEDGSVCTTGDTCKDGTCTGWPGIECGDNNACTTDSCDPKLGCQHPPVQDGQACNDNNQCTTKDECKTGACTGSQPPDCNDGKACTNDSCDPAAGCLHVPKVPCCGNAQIEAGEQCDDGNTTPGDGCDANCQDEILNQPECKSYTQLSESNRNTKFNDGDGNVELCDGGMGDKWYRFTGGAGTRMPTSCPAEYACGTDAPGWMNGAHPSVQEGIVSRQVCYHWGGCCNWSNTIQVRNCGPYYVYKLYQPPAGCLRYCGTD